jgi:hypothetical protein
MWKREKEKKKKDTHSPKAHRRLRLDSNILQNRPQEIGREALSEQLCPGVNHGRTERPCASPMIIELIVFLIIAPETQDRMEERWHATSVPGRAARTFSGSKSKQP